VIEDPQLLANDGIVEIGAGGSGTTQRSVNGPVRFSDVARHIAAVPALGEHTDEVIRELAGGAGEPGPA
jgi:crotonobetainyl-CoA:carnitine CoA-transferase CaiB-like acyl-CoA transferase